jgi:adenylylsulfate kinase
MEGRALWITGLPGSGKSALADALIDAHPSFVLLRMDDFRKTVTPDPSYSDAERDIVYRSIVFLAAKLATLGHDVIIDATGNRRRWRDLARELIPRFSEVYLKCPPEVCMEREGKRKKRRGAPGNIYRKGAIGWPVPGVNAPYEEPLNPEVVIETDRYSTEEAVRSVDVLLKKGGLRGRQKKRQGKPP